MSHKWMTDKDGNLIQFRLHGFGAVSLARTDAILHLLFDRGYTTGTPDMDEVQLVLSPFEARELGNLLLRIANLIDPVGVAPDYPRNPKAN